MAIQSGGGKWLAKGVHQFIWNAMANGDTGIPTSDVTLENKEFSVTGTFGSGGSVSIEGSNDGTNWAPVKDWQGNPVVFTAAGNKTVVDNPQFLRPNCTAGDGTTALLVKQTSQTS